MNQRFLGTCVLLTFATIANAHFVFVVPQPGGNSAQVFISEELKPSDEVDIGLIGEAKLSVRDAQGHETPLALVKAEHAYTTTLAGGGTRLIHGVADLGQTQRGQEKAYRLLYYPKTIVGDAFDPKAIVAGETPVEIVPLGRPGELRLKVLAHGKPLPKSEVTIILPDATQKKMMTGDAGLTEALPQTGRYGAWARYWEGDIRNYATLVFDVPATSTAPRFATLPEATSSFGGVVSDGWLYVYGGHVSPTHSYSTESVSGKFARLKLSEGGSAWEQLPGGPALQGLNLAAHNGKIYRIGGMSPRNKPGEKEATYSVADCARFDPATKQWESLPPLPEARSSHDVVVIGDKLIVTGGWTLKGPERSVWLDTFVVLDLAAGKLEWKSSKQPFQRRALIAAAHSGKMYVMGGIDEHGKISHDVAVYDPQAAVWTEGPKLPGGEIDGFAPAACEHDGSLYVSIASGELYRLDESKQGWEKSGNATPRVAHRIASNGKTILVIGGAAKGRNLDLIEAIPVGS